MSIFGRGARRDERTDPSSPDVDQETAPPPAPADGAPPPPAPPPPPPTEPPLVPPPSEAVEQASAPAAPVEATPPPEDTEAVQEPEADTSGAAQAAAAADAAREAKEYKPNLKEPLPHPTQPRIIAVANQKGGVGKTTTAVNLGAGLAERGLRVLVVDLDPQGNASTGLGLNIRELDATMYDVLLDDVPIEDCIEPSEVRNLFVAPASLDLAGAEIELVSAMSRELKLRTALQPVKEDYDYILIDCPPSLGLLTLNAFAAVGEVLVPIQCEYYALEGLGQLLHNVELVQKALNPTLEVSTVVLVMYDARTTLAEDVATDVREHLGERVTKTVIPRTVRLSEAPSYGQPITTFDPKSRGAWAYRRLAEEVAHRGSAA